MWLHQKKLAVARVPLEVGIDAGRLLQGLATTTHPKDINFSSSRSPALNVQRSRCIQVLSMSAANILRCDVRRRRRRRGVTATARAKSWRPPPRWAADHAAITC